MKFKNPGNYILASVILFSGVTILVKYLDYIPFYELIIFRAVISAVISVFTLKQLKIPLWGNDKRTLLARGLVGTMALMLYFYSLQNLPLASAVTLQYLSPIFSIIFAYLILKESIGLIDGVLFVVAFIGVYLIKGFDPRVTTFETVLAVSGAVLAGLAYTLVSKLKKTDHALVVVFYFPLVTIPIVGPFAIKNWVWPRGNDIWAALAVGILTHMAQLAMTKGYQSGPMKFVSLYKYIGVVIAIFAGYVFFNEPLTWQAGIGISIVFVSLAIANWKRAKN